MYSVDEMNSKKAEAKVAANNYTNGIKNPQGVNLAALKAKATALVDVYNFMVNANAVETALQAEDPLDYAMNNFFYTGYIKLTEKNVKDENGDSVLDSAIIEDSDKEGFYSLVDLDYSFGKSNNGHSLFADPDWHRSWVEAKKRFDLRTAIDLGHDTAKYFTAIKGTPDMFCPGMVKKSDMTRSIASQYSNTGLQKLLQSAFDAIKFVPGTENASLNTIKAMTHDVGFINKLDAKLVNSSKTDVKTISQKDFDVLITRAFRRAYLGLDWKIEYNV